MTKMIITEVTDGCPSCPFFHMHPTTCTYKDNMPSSLEYRWYWQRWWREIFYEAPFPAFSPDVLSLM
jgi:hypothetical protein